VRLLLPLALSGCNLLCAGLQCEDRYPASQLAMVNGDQEGTLNLNNVGSFRQGSREAENAWSVVSAGDLLVGQPAQGMVSAFENPQESIDERARWCAFRGEFGVSMAVSGNWLVVGSPGSGLSAGRAQAFRYDQGTCKTQDGRPESEEAFAEYVGEQVGHRMGERVALCGDVDGGGQEDVIITAPWFGEMDGYGRLFGAIYLVSGETLPTLVPIARWVGSESSGGFGTAVVCNEDLDGDGLADVLVSEPFRAGGVVWQIPGTSASGSVDQVGTSLVEGASAFGLRLALEGAALAVGSPQAEARAGRVDVYDLAAGVATLRSSLVPDGDDLGAGLEPRFGSWVAWDSGDLYVGGPSWRPSSGTANLERGRVWRIPGATSLEDANLRLNGGTAFQRVGRTGVLHDLDGDGLRDLVLPVQSRRP